MPVTLPDIARAGRETREALERRARQRASALQQWSSSLARSIGEGSVSLDEIDAFIREFPGIPADLNEYLRYQQGALSFQQGHHEAALKYCDVALAVKENPATWLWKGTVLLQLDRAGEALEAFRKAYSLREGFGAEKEGYLKDLFWVWGSVAFLLGLDAALDQDAVALQKQVKEFLEVREKATEAGGGADLGRVVFQEPGPAGASVASNYADHPLVIQAHETAELRRALEELKLAIYLLSIKDPFEGWRALSREVSKQWPKGLSAVDAIREQRDREWNR